MSEAEGMPDYLPFLSSLQNGESPDDVAAQAALYLAAIKSAAGSPSESTASDTLQLVRDLLTEGAPESLTRNMFQFPLQVRKDMAKLAVALLTYRDVGGEQLGPDHLKEHPGVIEAMIQGYESDATDVALICGSMLREVLRLPSTAELILNCDAFVTMFDHLLNPNFDVASDAFDSFKELLTHTSNKQIIAAFLEENYEMFFEGCSKVLTSEHFLSRLQLMKLLGELLFDRSNFVTMKRYISEPVNLKLIMQLLKDKSAKISSEAFNVFKIFIANPEKAPGIMEILLKNQAKLLDFIGKFEPDEAFRKQFDSERQLVIDAISNLNK